MCDLKKSVYNQQWLFFTTYMYIHTYKNRSVFGDITVEQQLLFNLKLRCNVLMVCLRVQKGL